MTRDRKPTIRKGVASHYASAIENIYDLSDGRSGALISVRRDNDDNLIVDIYRADADVLVRTNYVNLDHRDSALDPSPVLADLLDEVNTPECADDVNEGSVWEVPLGTTSIFGRTLPPADLERFAMALLRHAALARTKSR